MGEDYRPGSIVDCDPQWFRPFSHGLPDQKGPAPWEDQHGAKARAPCGRTLLALMLFKVVATETQLDINVDKIPLERGAGSLLAMGLRHCATRPR
jgi:hypothetical protein